MTGLTDYVAKGLLAFVTGACDDSNTTTIATPITATSGKIGVVSPLFLALFTAVGTDAGTGFTEVTGGAYARQQVAGPATTTAGTTTAQSTVTIGGGVPAWVTANTMTGAGGIVYNQTTGKFVGTISTVGGTSITLTANAINAITSGDIVFISFFGQPTGSAPSTVTNAASIILPTATLLWGTVIAFGLYDASSSGNLWAWDFLGNFGWLPFEIPTTSNLATVKANGYSSNDPIVFTAEYGGTLPSSGITQYTIYFVATPATDTINVDTTSGPSGPISTGSSGSGMVRKIVQQPIAANVTASFAASSLTITAA